MAEKVKDSVATEVQSPPAAPALTGEQFAQLLEVIGKNKTVEAEVQANALKEALRPPQSDPPGISAYNPRGERDHPRPPLRTQFFFGPYPFFHDTLTYDEIVLLNQLRPGKFIVTKADGSKVPFTVRETMDITGTTPERVDILFPAVDAESNKNWMPLTAMLREVLAQAPASPSAA
jgi:hypothetical protein